MAMTAADVVEVLDRLDGAGIDAWLDGGWAVDALLGEQTRPHDDVDLIVRVDAVAAMRGALAEAGFRLVRGEPSSNFVLGDRDGREVDVHPVTFDQTGDGVYRMESGDDWRYPAEGFGGCGRIERREVRCLTADVQMLCHSVGYEPAGTDFHDMRLLNARFGTRLLPPYGPS